MDPDLVRAIHGKQLLACEHVGAALTNLLLVEPGARVSTDQVVE
jgi:hypothetical protein